jgi:integrase
MSPTEQKSQLNLNEKTIKALPAPAKGNVVHYFAGVELGGVTAPPGFGLRVTAAGAKSFVLGYRHKGVKRRFTIGQWPTWTALLAVKEARGLRRRIDKGEDPLGARRQDKAVAENSFKNICGEWHRLAGFKLRTGEERKRDLERLAFPWLGNKPIEDIKRSDIRKMLDRVAEENGEVMADRLLAYVSRVMSWHAARSDDFVSPIVRGMARTSSKERARQRVLSDDELRAVWRAAETFPGVFGKLVQFFLLTAARRAEAAGMEWPELDGDIWTLPGIRNKTKVDLKRPLTPAALAVLPPKGSSRYVFPAARGNVPIAGFSEYLKKLYEASGTSGWHIHDLRRTAKSLMSRAQVRPDYSEQCLGHTLPGIQGVYDVWAYLPEKRQAYEALAALIDRIVNPTANVVALRG